MALDMTDLSPEITPDEIRAAREEIGATQRELGEVFGVDHTTISRWELGAVPCGIPGAVRYALEYLKLRQSIMNDEVFQNLDASMAQLQQVRERLAQDWAGLERRKAGK